MRKGKVRRVVVLSRPADLGSVKEGSYVIIDGEPCRVVESEKSKPGKHGSAKIRLTAISVFTGSKKSHIGTSESHIEIPMIDKRSGQIVSTTPTTVQLMDLQSFEVFESPTPTDAEFEGKLVQGAEVEFWNVMGRNKIMRVKSSS
jgi:translation initiation factor 5A